MKRSLYCWMLFLALMLCGACNPESINHDPALYPGNQSSSTSSVHNSIDEKTAWKQITEKSDNWNQGFPAPFSLQIPAPWFYGRYPAGSWVSNSSDAGNYSFAAQPDTIFILSIDWQKIPDTKNLTEACHGLLSNIPPENHPSVRNERRWKSATLDFVEFDSLESDPNRNATFACAIHNGYLFSFAGNRITSPMAAFFDPILSTLSFPSQE